MGVLRPSLEDKAIIADDYFTLDGPKKLKKSISQNNLHDEEFEEVTDFNYIYTEAEWREILQNSSKLTQNEEQRLVCSIK